MRKVRTIEAKKGNAVKMKKGLGGKYDNTEKQMHDYRELRKKRMGGGRECYAEKSCL